jgi:cytochrome c oxidase subunit IV
MKIHLHNRVALLFKRNCHSIQQQEIMTFHLQIWVSLLTQSDCQSTIQQQAIMKIHRRIWVSLLIQSNCHLIHQQETMNIRLHNRVSRLPQGDCQSTIHQQELMKLHLQNWVSLLSKSVCHSKQRPEIR